MNTAAEILRALDMDMTLEELHALDSADLRRFKELTFHWYQLAQRDITDRMRIAEEARSKTAA